MSVSLYPLRFKPVYKDYIWGGNRIVRAFRRPEPPGICAESWEVSTRPEGMSVVSHGPLAGRTLQELCVQCGADLLGSRIAAGPFPLLIKLIDSRERLSVQVHPSDETAAPHGGEAKTEMWYVLEAQPGAQVFAGLQPGVTRKAFEEAVRQTRIDSLLAAVPVSAGDAIFMPGGRVHALDAGCLILEVQQNSNTTYRIYDWGRVGHDGRPRETHLAQALRVIRWDDRGDPRLTPVPLPAASPNQRFEIVRGPHFFMEKILLRTAWMPERDGAVFEVVFSAHGDLRMRWAGGEEHVPVGTSVLIPASLKEVAIEPTDRDAVVLRMGP